MLCGNEDMTGEKRRRLGWRKNVGTYLEYLFDRLSVNLSYIDLSTYVFIYKSDPMCKYEIAKGLSLSKYTVPASSM